MAPIVELPGNAEKSAGTASIPDFTLGWGASTRNKKLFKNIYGPKLLLKSIGGFGTIVELPKNAKKSAGTASTPDFTLGRGASARNKKLFKNSYGPQLSIKPIRDYIEIF